jgi:hypothetical protein
MTALQRTVFPLPELPRAMKCLARLFNGRRIFLFPELPMKASDIITAEKFWIYKG